MDTKHQLEFLKEQLATAVKQYLDNEVSYRSTTSLMMSTAKPTDQLNQAQSQAKKLKEALELKIRNYRGLISEIEKGDFVV